MNLSNYIFGQLVMWIGENNDQIWLPMGWTSDSEQCSNRMYTYSWGLILIKEIELLKGHLQGRKGQDWPIFHSVVTKCCPNLLHNVASLLWNQLCPKIWKVWNHSKGHFQGQKCPISVLIIYLNSYLKTITGYNQCVYETHMQSYNLSVYIKTFDLRWPWMVQ